jgi:hypothetical protein
MCTPHGIASSKLQAMHRGSFFSLQAVFCMINFTISITLGLASPNGEGAADIKKKTKLLGSQDILRICHLNFP